MDKGYDEWTTVSTHVSETRDNCDCFFFFNVYEKNYSICHSIIDIVAFQITFPHHHQEPYPVTIE